MNDKTILIDLNTILTIANDAQGIVNQVVAEKKQELPKEILAAFSEGADVVLTYLRKFHETMEKSAPMKLIPVANTNLN